jgi:hypothetical protein
MHEPKNTDPNVTWRALPRASASVPATVVGLVGTESSVAILIETDQSVNVTTQRIFGGKTLGCWSLRG